jgi:hypothetical protein
LLDLLVGNGFGDVLHLQGKGDGTFQISGDRVSLSVVPDLLGNGQAGVLVGNQQDNRVTIQAPTSGGSKFSPVQTLGGNNATTQLAPGDVQWFALDQDDPLPYPVVVSSGSNAVIVYRTTGLQNGVLSFASTPQTLFVGTSPAGVTAADVNGDGIPDLLVANQGSNDVSVIFGSYDAHGDWVGIPGPRLKSGGDGPLAVTVRADSSTGLPDLVVTNGGSGTITLLPGVGQGFFDDQHPRTLFNLGGALAQAPTFVGTSGLGYAVTVGGEVVRFDLDHPGDGAQVVYSTQDVLAARALASGQVVVALAGGTVEVLTPQGNGLSVAAELQAQGGVPVLPSALEVLQTDSGQAEVLVTSAGSDSVFVFTAAGGKGLPPGEVTLVGLTGLSVGGAVPPLVLGGSAVAVTSSPTVSSAAVPVLVGLTTGSAAGGLGVADTAAATGALSVSAVSVSLSATTGLALGTVTASSNGGGTEESVALVQLQGNTYSTVALLDFGSGGEDDAGSAGGRLPGLSSRYAVGDTSPLTRFVIGQEAAVQHYREEETVRFPGTGEAADDPWMEDLFQQVPPSWPLIHDRQEEKSQEGSSPEVWLPGWDPEGVPDARRSGAGFWEQCHDDPDLAPSGAAAWEGADWIALTALLAGTLLGQASAEREGERRSL